MKHLDPRPLLRRYQLAMLALLALCSSGVVQAAQPSGTLIQAWLSFPDAADIAWPYAYIRAEQTRDSQEGARKDLFDEYERLRWRLEDDRYPQLVKAVKAWKSRLAAMSAFRVPGNWSPSFLMSHVNQRPPIDDVAALGACQVPDSIAVWDAKGVRDITWQSGMQLSDVEDMAPALRQGSAPDIAVVDPYGRIDHYGVQAWNYADGPVAPGSQIVASLPLKGSAFVWIRDAMADVLAHTPSGIDCREVPLIEANQDD